MKTSSLLLCLFLSCFLQAQWDTSRIILQGKHMVIISHPDSAVRYAFAFGEEGTLKAEGRYAQNDTSKVGWWTTYHSNGKRESIGKYKAGKKVGYWKHFHTNGEIESAGWYEEGRSYGWWEFYTAFGEIEKQGHYVDGKKHGFWTFYHKGVPQKQGMFAGDNPTGCWKYFENGTLKRVVWLDE